MLMDETALLFIFHPRIDLIYYNNFYIAKKLKIHERGKKSEREIF